MDIQREIEELRKRIEELERRPIYIPVPVYPYVPPAYPWYQPPSLPYFGDQPPSIWCGSITNGVIK